MNIMPHTVFEILKFKKSCNLNAKYSTFGLNFSCFPKYPVFSKISLCHFLVYMTKCHHAKITKTCKQNKTDEQTDRQTDRQTDGWMNRTDYLRPFL